MITMFVMKAAGGANGLLAELDALGIQIEAHEGRLRFQPRDVVTADLAARMNASKTELIVALTARRRIREQISLLVAYRTADGRRTWVHPLHRSELERAGLL